MENLGRLKTKRAAAFWIRSNGLVSEVNNWDNTHIL